MKNNSCIPHWVVAFFGLTLVVAFASWIGSIYGGEPIHSILSVEGMRWVLSHALAHYVEAPALGIVLVMLMGIGVGAHAGFYNALGRLLKREKHLSTRERHSLAFALAVLMAYALIVFLSSPFLMSVTGTWTHSPLQKGFFNILSLGIGISGVVYGYASGTYRVVSDVVGGLTCLVTRCAGYFVVLFFIVQFFSVLSYTGLTTCLGMNEEAVYWLSQLCCYAPLTVVHPHHFSK